ncbi:hypothetical protein BO94DRAFT_505852 [Aspergillus sclerotioniger CBS 115572]|uniref:Alpha/beta-hydrolase n=1 Tax=Aspergillus sclerotioniger CBS 115572 TaxID=1450535 RepID=A0A317XDE4_9EURO|nr:hypothetical protein BO94DRAFT_505852 [Aspergillus sclerotioniger CBS 115572]PWY96533.1 hypothetical protein BO94DRAFT_505852 [Aspergillus sclerotioniger CBS 115572]
MVIRAGGWNSLVLCILLTLCMSCALVAPCLAEEFHIPLASYADSGLQWNDCGEANNHTIQCSRLDVPVDHFSQSSEKAFSIPIIRMLAKKASDMNSILDAIGQQKMYYWGLSYGTTLGQTYAQMFPDRVSRMVLDGVSNLAEWYNSLLYGKSLIDTDRIFTGFIEECFEAKEACPLNLIKGEHFESAGQLRSYIDGFLRELEEEPIPVYLNSTNYGAITRRSLVTNGILFALYKPTTWPVLAKNLAELLNGNTTPAYSAYSESWVLKFLLDDSTTFISLNDNRKTGQEAPVHGIKPIHNHTISRPEMSSLVSKYQGSDIYYRASWSIPTTHNFHPRYHPGFPRTRTAEPILILSTTRDPVCPLVSAKKVQNSFEGARLVEQISYGHCSLSMPSLCTVNHLRRYYSEGILPEPGATCGIDVEYFPSPRGSAVSTLSIEEEELLSSLHELATKDVLLVRGQ